MPKHKPTREEITAAVDAWFAKAFRNSALSRDTKIYNAAVLAKADLTASICDLCADPEPAETNDGDST